MLDVGDVIEIGGNQVLVCFLTEYDNKKYLCASTEFEDNVKFDIYQYKDDDNKLMVAKVEDEEELKPLLTIFFKDGLNDLNIEND